MRCKFIIIVVIIIISSLESLSNRFDDDLLTSMGVIYCTRVQCAAKHALGSVTLGLLRNGDSDSDINSLVSAQSCVKEMSSKRLSVSLVMVGNLLIHISLMSSIIKEVLSSFAGGNTRGWKVSFTK